jgi:spore germination protein PB
MQLNVQQTIVIHQFQVESVSNSSVLQVGSAGSIQNMSQLYNSGGFTGPAPPLTSPGTFVRHGPPLLVPLIPPSVAPWNN